MWLFRVYRVSYWCFLKLTLSFYLTNYVNNLVHSNQVTYRYDSFTYKERSLRLFRSGQLIMLLSHSVLTREKSKSILQLFCAQSNTRKRTWELFCEMIRVLRKSFGFFCLFLSITLCLMDYVRLSHNKYFAAMTEKCGNSILTIKRCVLPTEKVL